MAELITTKHLVKHFSNDNSVEVLGHLESRQTNANKRCFLSHYTCLMFFDLPAEL